MQVATITRGLPVEEGGYHWNGELQLWDNELLMGWYAANEGSIRSGRVKVTSSAGRVAQMVSSGVRSR